MVSRPWMPLYIADYLADTTHLSAAEHGAYLLLIMHYWQAGGLPCEDRKLARIARMSDKEWKEARETIAEFFSEGWRHERIEKELGEANEKYERRAKAGREGGIARSQRIANGKHQDSNATGIASDPSSNATAMPQALLNQPQPQPDRTDKSPASRPTTRARARSDDELVKLRLKIVQAFEAVNRPAPDTNRCAVWVSQGYRPDVIVAVIAEILQKKPDVRALGYFDGAIADAHKSQAPPDVAPSERLVDLGYAGVQMPEKNLVAAIERWRKNPASWLRNVWGPPPDESAIIRKFAAEQGIDLGKVEDAA